MCETEASSTIRAHKEFLDGCLLY